MIRVGLYGGGRVTIADDGSIDVSQVTPGVLAHGLARVTRFGGQTDPALSVAEHSARLYDWAAKNHEPRPVLAALLLHDAPECLGIGDVQRYVKRRYATTLREFDGSMIAALWSALRPPGFEAWHWCDVEEVVHRYDGVGGASEAEFFGFDVEPSDLWGGPPGMPETPVGWPHAVAERQWLIRWTRVTEDR